MEDWGEWIRWALPILIGYIAWEVRQLRLDMTTRVLRVDCDRRMKQHDDRLNKLEDKAEKNKANIGKIIACHNQLNSDCKLDDD